MKYRILALSSVLLIACQGERTAIRGSLADGANRCAEYSLVEVFAQSSSDTANVDGCRFGATVRDSGTVRIAIASQEGILGRMRLDGVASGERINLDGIWMDERGLAFPASVSLQNGQVLTVNGIRMSGAGVLPPEVATSGSVLAVAEGAGALIVRSVRPELPDLRVQVDSTTVLRSTTGNQASLGGLAYGDSVQVEGAIRDRVVFASNVVIPVSVESRSRARSGSSLSREIERLLDAVGIRVQPEPRPNATSRRSGPHDDDDSDSDSR